MSTIEHTASVSFGKIPIGRRISELMLERGDAFSVRAFAERLGVNRETFRLTLLGQRPLSLSLLEEIVSKLGISEDRLRQRDASQKEETLNSLLTATERTNEMMLHAHTIAQELVDIAVGYTERCISLGNLGRVQFHLQQYDLAHESWLKSMEFAELIYKHFSDQTLLYHVSSFLLISFTVRREYTNILHTLDLVEGAFPHDPEKMGSVSYTRMKWHEHRGDLNKALDYATLSLGYFTETKSPSQIGKAMLNVAHFHYQLGNYEDAKQFLSSSLGYLSTYDFPKLYAVKDLAKTLLKLGDPVAAISLIRKHLKLAEEYPDLSGKLKILLSAAEDRPTYAESVSDDVNVPAEIRYSACKFLMTYYTSKRDSESVMHYYEKSNALLTNQGELLDEEGF